MKLLGRLIGIVILVGILGIAWFFYGKKQGKTIQMPDGRQTATLIKGYLGGEKSGFVANREVIDILRNQYGLELDNTKAGSIEMVLNPLSDMDFLWPSSQVALDLFKSMNPGSQAKSEIIFNSPIVVYSWDTVTDALIREQIVRMVDQKYYIIDFPKLIGYIEAGKKWADIGLTDMYGTINIISTDPTKSNSGNMYAGLLANIINNNEVVTTETVESLLPRLKKVFARQGYMEHSSGDLFNAYITMGRGSKPLVVGYESQIIEFAVQNKAAWPKIQGRIRILYPEPTVWSSHPLIAISKPSLELLTAMKDPQLQKIAWEKHGFRSGLMGVQNDPGVLKMVGIPEQISKIIPMPGYAVMDRIIRELTVLNSTGL